MNALDRFSDTPTIKYVPYGKIVDYVTSELRKETPEEHVRQRVARSLVEEYGYKKSELELNFHINVFSKRYPVDIAVFAENRDHKIENIYMIIETKKEKIKPTDRENGIDQLKEYVGACFNSRYGMWTNGLEKFCYEKKIGEDNTAIFEEIVDIPLKGKTLEEYEKLSFDELRPAVELISVFERCHNYIHGNQGLDKAKAFHELLKVIFCKVYDERESGARLRFYVTSAELRTAKGHETVRDRINGLFLDLKSRYEHIFKNEREIELEPRVLAYVVGQLEHYSLISTDTDVKGQAYETIVGANLKGDRGEFFTPRNVCRLSVEGLFATFTKDKWNKLKILDPACGTGGFLVTTINFIRDHFLNEELKRWQNDPEKANNAIIERIKEYCVANLYGIDFNPLLVRASQMNEVMNGNGSGNLFSVNSLLPPGDWPEEVQAKMKLQSFDMVFTNPPFGSKIPITDPHILAQYDLGHVWEKEDNGQSFKKIDKLKASVPPEQLFVERCLQFLKPKGRLSIVLPDSILSNPGLAYIRYWILKKTKLIASFDLPRVTFEPFVGAKTSVLFLQKKAEEEIRVEEESGHPVDYEVFMSIADRVGHDRRNKPEYLRTNEGEEIVEIKPREIITIVGKNREREIVSTPVPRIADDLPGTKDAFVKWFRDKGSIFE